MAFMIETPRLLISDDDRDFRETLRAVFESRGFGTMLAADGEEAVNIVRRETIHVVLIDLHMPKLSGLEAIAQIRLVQAAIPCILISAGIDESIQQQADAYSVLKKPVTHREVTEVVASAMVSFYDWDGPY